MTDSMIERVAEAAAAEFKRQAAAGDIVAHGYVNSTTTMDAGCQFIEGEANLRLMACAVLTAMREETDPMGDAGATEVDRGNPYDRDIAGNVWTKMIDAALEDGR